MELDLFYRFIACMLNWFHSRSKRAVKGTERWKKTQAGKKEWRKLFCTKDMVMDNCSVHCR